MRTKKFIIVSVLFLMFSLWVDHASAQESVSDSESQTTLLAQSYATKLETRFGLYHQKLESLLDSFDQVIVPLDSTDPQVKEIRQLLLETEKILELAGEQSHQAVFEFRQLDQIRDVHRREKALEAKQLATSARNSYIQVVENLRQTMDLTKRYLETSSE